MTRRTYDTSDLWYVGLMVSYHQGYRVMEILWTFRRNYGLEFYLLFIANRVVLMSHNVCFQNNKITVPSHLLKHMSVTCQSSIGADCLTLRLHYMVRCQSANTRVSDSGRLRHDAAYYCAADRRTKIAGLAFFCLGKRGHAGTARSKYGRRPQRYVYGKARLSSDLYKKVG